MTITFAGVNTIRGTVPLYLRNSFNYFGYILSITFLNPSYFNEYNSQVRLFHNAIFKFFLAWSDVVSFIKEISLQSGFIWKKYVQEKLVCVLS